VSWFGRLQAAGLATGTLVALLAPSLASGAGQTYEVVQCDPLNRDVSDVTLEDAPAYAVKQMCADPHNNHAIKITNTRFARHGRLGRVQWSTGSPALRIGGGPQPPDRLQELLLAVIYHPARAIRSPTSL
jgi:hypothetical protein